MKPVVASRRSVVAPRILVLAAILLAGCAGEAASQEAPAVAQEDDAARVLAILDGEPITRADLEDVVGDQLANLEYQYRSQQHQLLEAGLEQVIRDRLLGDEAESRGMTVDELVAAEVGEIEVSDSDVVAFYQANQARLQGRSLEQLRSPIRQFLTQQRQEEGIAALTDRLAANRALDRRLEPFRVEIETAGHPTWGREDAPVTLLEFSDFECPFCGGFFPTLQRVKQEFGDRVRIVYRQFPLRQLHPNAQKAAEASLCAADQGSFWEMHDLLFTEQQSLTVPDLKDKAARLGLDTEEFAACLDSGRHVEQVQSDLDAGARVGVDSTPALFVNGRPVEGGAVPFETVAEVVRDELARSGS